MGSTSMASLWKLERAQTRLRMSRSQVRFWCKLTLLLWLCGAVVYFLVGIGVVGRLQLGLWLWASLWAGVWPAKVVFYEGQYYYAGQFAPWLTASVYGQPVAAWVWESIGWGTLPAVALVVALFVWLHWRSEAEQAGGQHVRGVHLLEGKALQTKLWGFRWWQRWLGARPAAPGVVIAGVELPRPLESSHIAVVGATGTRASKTRGADDMSAIEHLTYCSFSSLRGLPSPQLLDALTCEAVRFSFSSLLPDAAGVLAVLVSDG